MGWVGFLSFNLDLDHVSNVLWGALLNFMQEEEGGGVLTGLDIFLG